MADRSRSRRRTAARAVPGLVLAFAAVFALSSLPGAGSTAHAQVLVSSLEQTEGSTRLRPHEDNIQAFTTGINGTGYTLTGVEIDLGQSSSMANAPFTVKISEYSVLGPGDEVATLTAPASLGVGRRTRTFTHSGVSLDAITTYFVFLDSGGAGAGNFRTNSGGRDSGEEGWSVADSSRRYEASGETPGWRTVSAPLRMRINGRANALPELANFTVSSIAAQPTQLSVDWDAYSGADKYLVRWKTGSDAFDSHELTETEYTITDLTTHEVYTVEVIAIDTGTTPNTHIAKSAGTGVPGAPTITFSAGDAVTEGTAATFTVTASFAPASDLKVNLFVWDAVSPSDFLASENEDEQTVTITSGKTTATLTIPTVGDSNDEPDGEIEVLPVEGTGYILGTTERVKVAVSDDDDAAGAKPAVTFSGGDAVTEGTAIDFTVMVSSAPASDLEIFLGILDAPLPSRFIDRDAYPRGKWSVTIAAGETSTTVSVPTIDDTVDEPDGEVWITVLTNASLGSAYEDAAGILKVLVSDNDGPSSPGGSSGGGPTDGGPTDGGPTNGGPPLEITLGLSQESLSVSEMGGEMRYTVVLNAAPTGPVIVTPTSPAPTVVTVSGPLTFTPANWATPQPVLVRGVNDDVDNPGDVRRVRITHTIAGVPVADLLVTVRDDDTAGVTVSATAVTVSAAGGTARYTVVLDTEPSGPVTVTPRSPAPAVVTVSGPLTFTPATWNVPQPVTVRAAAEATAGQMAVLTHGVAGYGAVTRAEAVTVTVVPELSSTRLAPWLSRFGRTVGTHMTDAVGTRLWGGSAPDSHVTVGGYRLPLRAARASRGAALLEGVAGLLGLNPGGGADAPVGEPTPDPRREPASRLRAPDLRALLLGSSFRLNLGSGTAGTPRLTAWGRVAGTTFDGREGALTLDGDVLTGTVGVDGTWARWLAGVMVSHSRGDGAVTRPAADRFDMAHTLTSLHPYLRYAVTDRLDVWGLLGYGWGEVTQTPDAGAGQATDTTLLMGVVGSRGVLRTAAEPGGVDLALRTDLMLTRTTADAVTGAQGRLAAAEGDAHRLRLVLEGARGVTWAEGRQLTPTLQLGLRHDWGDAETGFGLEVGGRVQYADPTLGLTVEGAVRGLVVHADSAYEEWGASGSVRFAPGAWGQGLAVTVAPAWGATASGVEGLWTGATPLAGGPAGPQRSPGGRVTAEVGYGVAAFARGLLTPYAGTSLAAGADRTYRVGTRWQAAGVTLNLEGARQVAAGTRPGNQGLRVQASWGF